jgi:hypothetical protein
MAFFTSFNSGDRFWTASSARYGFHRARTRQTSPWRLAGPDMPAQSVSDSSAPSPQTFGWLAGEKSRNGVVGLPVHDPARGRRSCVNAVSISPASHGNGARTRRTFSENPNTSRHQPFGLPTAVVPIRLFPARVGIRYVRCPLKGAGGSTSGNPRRYQPCAGLVTSKFDDSGLLSRAGGKPFVINGVIVAEKPTHDSECRTPWVWANVRPAVDRLLPSFPSRPPSWNRGHARGFFPVHR